MLFRISWKRWALILLCGAALFFLYLFGLTRTGLLGPDEPRYAAIGRAMSDTGDWITPRLWGEPWFEKPALLYWMTAAGFKAGLDLDLAPRVPVALLSVAFLIYFFAALRREFGERPAFYATAILATSAGWLAYSHIAVPDLPMSVAFAAAMLMVMRKTNTDTNVCATVAGLLLGLAVLAKGLVPLVLFLPAVWYMRRRVRELLIVFAAAAVIAVPWYALATMRNGTQFLEDFFLKHHFERFFSGALQHERPIWYFIPVLAAGLFPWTPLALTLFSKRIYRDPRATFLVAWFAWGFLFFSLSSNKLPGYLLPLLPAVAALLGVAIAGVPQRAAKMIWLLAACAALLWFIPAIQDTLPQALLSGLSRARVQLPTAWIFPACGIALCCGALEWTGRRALAIGFVSVLMTLAAVLLIWQTYPVLDRSVSARNLWLTRAESITCVSEEDRSQHYGLNYYAARNLPDCN